MSASAVAPTDLRPPSTPGSAVDASTLGDNRAPDPQNPWPGLAAFDETTARFFHGRGRESAELEQLVSQAPLTVLFGKSGLGKTSLLQAGVFPLLRGSGILPVYVRLRVQDRDAALIEQLDAALLREARLHGVDMLPHDFEGSIWERLHHKAFALWDARNQLLTPLFVLDQFEEVFTLGAANAAGIQRLRIDLANLIENRIPAALLPRQDDDSGGLAALDPARQRYKVLLSLREDFLPDLESWRRDIPSLMHKRFRLTTMNGSQAFDAVYKTGAPAKLVDGATAEAIVRFVGKIQSDERSKSATAAEAPTEAANDDLSRFSIEPALLSLVCSELNKLRQNAKPPRESINAELLKGTGDSIIADFYLRQVAKVPAATRRFIEEDLLTEGGYRTSFPVQEALKSGALDQTTLDLLVDGRLLRIDHQLGIARVELTHDRLTDIVGSERDKRRARERNVRVRHGVIGLLIIVLPLAVWGTWLYIQGVKAEAGRVQALEALKEAQRQRDIAENAVREAQAQRDEARRQQQIAEEAKKAAETAREAAEKARAAAEAERQKTIEAQQYAETQRRAAAEQQQIAAAQAQRADAQAQAVKRQNVILGEAFAPLRPAVLRLQVRDFMTSTAFFTSRAGHVVAAAHTVTSGRRSSGDRTASSVVTLDGATLRAEVLKVDEGRDVALLRVSPPAASACLQLADEPPRPGAAVVALSISIKTDWAAASGTVTRVNVAIPGARTGKAAGFMDANDLIEVAIDAEGGFSGAPVVEAASRRVIGIGAYGIQGETRRHFLIPASRIRAALGGEAAALACR